ncbi:maltose acetyltransferase domain-containing protein [Nocardioides zhouii]|uniref:maltose acetyltransferase domain-containing protein n=1 Tax=Nocardioides zhouii TaxID=1168729 RepID=UPI002414617A|nr:maltose acetyltransferase domain-containing protein [Nocardioides zhouii]
MPDERTMRERMLAGDLYLADDPQIGADSRRALGLAHRINHTDPTDSATLRELFTELLGHYGDGAEIRPPFQCDYGYQTSFGARSFANFGLVVLDVATVTIGKDVQIGPGVQLLTATHPLEPGPRRDKWEAAEPITIATTSGWVAGSSSAPA